MEAAKYNRPVTIQRPRVAAGSGAQMRMSNGRYGSSVRVQPGSYIPGATDGWGNFYNNLPDAMRANPRASVSYEFIKP